MNHRARTAATTVALAAALVAGGAAPARAQDVVVDFPAGVACEFAVTVEIEGGNARTRDFFDEDGNIVRTLVTGRGDDLTFINAETGESLVLAFRGAAQRVTYHPDGTQTVVASGHVVLILFPTDVPAGPTTTLYAGRIEFTIDAAGVFTLQRTSGTSTDLCAALA
ncbi:hypothetical protein [Naasia sp. SYSU D00948]|uniref:hypothetical protein n=1 Tax=Naasia sp. SYSU D00948 TaxID=2817379 RepID=UPI001B317065|nr:hypothetical protein [Naasia sp. SYSU D00948]